MRRPVLLLALVLGLAGCGDDGEGGAAAPEITTETTKTQPRRATPATRRNRPLERHLRQYLPLGAGSYYKQVGSIIVTNKVRITTKTSDPAYLYNGLCQTALDLAAERGVTEVDVIDASGVTKASSVSADRCEARY